MYDILIKKPNIDFFLINYNNYMYMYAYINIKKVGVFLLLNNNFFIFNDLNYIKIYTSLYKNIKLLKLFFFSWNYFFTKKVKVRHKVSWLKLFRKNYFIMKINFGFSYNVIFFLYNVYFSKKRKIMKHSNILFWGINSLFLFKIAKFIVNIQPVDCYSLRGFKFSKQRFIKKVGKISKYMDFKKKLL